MVSEGGNQSARINVASATFPFLAPVFPFMTTSEELAREKIDPLHNAPVHLVQREQPLAGIRAIKKGNPFGSPNRNCGKFQ